MQFIFSAFIVIFFFIGGCKSCFQKCTISNSNESYVFIDSTFMVLDTFVIKGDTLYLPYIDTLYKYLSKDTTYITKTVLKDSIRLIFRDKILKLSIPDTNKFLDKISKLSSENAALNLLNKSYKEKLYSNKNRSLLDKFYDILILFGFLAFLFFIIRLTKLF